MDNLTDDEVKCLEEIGECIPLSIIAGGYLRDTYLDKPIKDIDVFCPMGSHRWFDMHPDYKRTSGIGYNTSSMKTYQHETNRLNIIVLSSGVDPKDWVECRFDIGLCQIYFDLTTKDLTLCEGFVKDVEDKTLTLDLRRCEDTRTQNNALHNHMGRLLKKYPEYTPKVVGFNEDVIDMKYSIHISPTIKPHTAMHGIEAVPFISEYDAVPLTSSVLDSGWLKVTNPCSEITIQADTK